jgi:hypothetical protein
VFEPTAALWAPLWVAERAVTVWLALGQRLFGGGVRYGEGRLRDAASTQGGLRRLHGKTAAEDYTDALTVEYAHPGERKEAPGILM